MSAAERPSGDLGRTLREARERRGVTLRQIANATKISVSVLESLERNDISRLPGGIFGRAFVRSYAVEVGLDPEQAIELFLEQFPHESVTTGHPTSKPFEDHTAIEGDRVVVTTFLWLGLVSLPIVALVLYFGTTLHRSAPSEEPASTAIMTSGSAGSARSAGAADPPALATPPAGPGSPGAGQPAASTDHLTVRVSATRRSWISAIVDGTKLVERTFEAGDERTVDVYRDLVLTVGDAAAVSMTLNGVSAKPLGKSGEVVTTRMSLANFRDYLSAP